MGGCSGVSLAGKFEGRFAVKNSFADYNHPSIRNARSICAVAASTSRLFPVSAARRSYSAAKSQCGRPWRQDRSRPTKRAACSNVASSPPGPPVGSITRVSANLKFGACAMSALWPTRTDDLKRWCTFLGVWAPPPAWSGQGFFCRNRPSVCDPCSQEGNGYRISADARFVRV
jgi:hypothetical protein